MKNKILIIILTLVLAIFVTVLVILKNNSNNNKIVSTITLDINPSIEINLSKNDKVISVKALNEDAEKIVNDDLKGKSLDVTLNIIVDNLIKNDYTTDNSVDVILYSKGNIENSNVKEKLVKSLDENDITFNIILIDKISEEDEELSKKYNITPAKASYINSIIKENNIDVENLIESSIKELNDTKETGYYCDKEYTLEGNHCLKEIDRIPVSDGEVCPIGYYDYEGKCYEEKPVILGEKDVCDDDFVLENGRCIKTDKQKAEGVCNNGFYIASKDKCEEDVYIGDAYEFCRDSGRTLYEHKCLATKPTINGGCLGSDKLLNGKCVNTKNDYYASEWKCPNGQMNSNADGSLLYSDNKCYEKKLVEPISYKCNEDYVLQGKECYMTIITKLKKETSCPDGYELVDNRCINYNKTVNKEKGFVCEKDNSRMKDNTCVIYEIVSAKNSQF